MYSISSFAIEQILLEYPVLRRKLIKNAIESNKHLVSKSYNVLKKNPIFGQTGA